MARLTTKLTLISMLLVGGISCSENKTVDYYMTQAEDAISVNEQERAIIALKNAAILDSKNPQVRFELGAVYLAQGDYVSAEKELENALSFGYEAGPVYAKLAEVKVKLYKLEEVYELVEVATKSHADNFIVVLTYAGIAALYAEDRDRAIDYIDRAIGVSESSIFGRLGRAYLDYQLPQSNESLNLVEQLINEEPLFTEAILLKGYLLQNSNQYEKAAQVFKKYSLMRPKELQVIFLATQNYILAGQLDLAEFEVDRLLNAMPNNPVANQQKAQIKFQKKEFQFAQEHANRAIQYSENFTLSKVIAGVSSYMLKDYEQAYQKLLTIKDRINNDPNLSRLMIDLQFKLGYEDEAFLLLKGISTNPETSDISLLTNSSFQFLKSGELEIAEELLDKSLDLETVDPEELTKQGVLHLALNQTVESIKVLEKATKINPELVVAEQSLAVAYLSEEQLEKAREIVAKWRQDDNKIVKSYLLESAILQKEGRRDEQKETLQKIINIEPENITALFSLGLFAHQENDLDKAFDYYIRVINENPKFSGASKNIIRLISQNEQYRLKTIEFLKSAINQNVDDNYLKLILAYAYRMTGEHNLSVQLFEEILNSGQPIEGTKQALAKSYDLIGNLNLAERNYQEALSVNPENLDVTYKLLAFYERSQQLDKAIKYVEDALNYHKNNKGLLMLKVYYQSRVGSKVIEKDMEVLQKDSKVQSNWLFDNILGNFAYKKKDFDKARIHYKAAYQKKKTTSNVLNWAKVTGLNGNMKKSIEILQEHLLFSPDSIATKAMLAGGYLKEGKISLAKQLYLEILEVNGQHIVALNNLANIFLQSKNYNQALNFAQRAIAVSPKNPNLIDTYGQALVANQHFKQGIAAYDKALSIVSGNATYSIRKAEALLATNEMEDARAVLLSITEMTNDEQEKINSLLSKIEQAL